MKITRRQLKRIIKEELSRTLLSEQTQAERDQVFSFQSSIMLKYTKTADYNKWPWSEIGLEACKELGPNAKSRMVDANANSKIGGKSEISRLFADSIPEVCPPKQ